MAEAAIASRVSVSEHPLDAVRRGGEHARAAHQHELFAARRTTSGRFQQGLRNRVFLGRASCSIATLPLR